MTHKDSSNYGMLAEYANTAAIFHACEKVRDAGYTKWDAHTPFPVHGLDRAMGLSRSKLPWLVLVCGLTGATFAFLLQWWTSAVAQPVVIAGKPMFSWQAFVPVTFELGVLFAAFAAVFGMLAMNGLPQLYHSVFHSERFARCSDDRFYISIEANDPNYDETKTRALLEEAGADHVEFIAE
jgi:hypothetical protein